MKNYRMKFLGAASLALLTFGLASPSQADTCAVRVVFTKGGFIVGVGGGRGVMVCKGKRYPFRGLRDERRLHDRRLHQPI